MVVALTESGNEMTAGTILAAIEKHVAHQPDNVFCHFQTGSKAEAISYADLAQRSASFGYFLQQGGLVQHETLLIILPHQPEMLYSFFGAMMLGAIPSFMPFPSSKQDHATFWASHQKLLKLTGIRFILTYKAISTGIQAYFADLGLTILYVEDESRIFEHAPINPFSAKPSDIAFLQHSSGTTGLKKGVVLSHRAVLRQIDSYASVLHLSADDVITSWLPLYHDMGLISCLIMTVVMGSKLIWMDPFEWVRRPTSLLDAIQAHRGTHTFMPNFAFLHIGRSIRPGESWDISSLKMMINCSEPCKAETFDKLYNSCASFGIKRETLQVCYAMAENVFAVSQTPPNRPVRLITLDIDALETRHQIVLTEPGPRGRVVVSCGAPLPGTRIRIVTAERGDAEVGYAGEIALAGDCLFDGYNKLPELTAEKFVDNWYYTGDLGFVWEGELFVLGRQDDLMIVYGRNYYAHNVEEVAATCPGVAPGRVVAFAVENLQMGTREVVVLLEANELQDTIELRLAAKKIIFDVLGLSVQHLEVVSRNSLIKSTAGKISRDQNHRIFVEKRASLGQS